MGLDIIIMTEERDSGVGQRRVWQIKRSEYLSPLLEKEGLLKKQLCGSKEVIS